MAFFENGSVTQTVTFCVMGCLSIIGCLTYLYCFFFLQPNRSLARKLLAFIAFTEGISIYGRVLGMIYMNTVSNYKYKDFGVDGYPYNCTSRDPQPKSEQFCVIQGFCCNFFTLSSFVFNSGLALFMLHLTVFNQPSRVLYHAVKVTAFLLPSVITFSVAFQGYYGFSVCTTGGWCWLRYLPDNGLFWQTLTGRLWEIVTELTLVLSYLSLRVVLWYKQKQVLKNTGATQQVYNTLHSIESLYSRLSLIPVIFFFCYIFGTVRTYLIDPNSTEFSHWILNLLSFLHGFGNNASGFCNFVLFVLMDKPVREALAEDLRHKWVKTRSFLLCDGGCSCVQDPNYPFRFTMDTEVEARNILTKKTSRGSDGNSGDDRSTSIQR